MERLAVRRGALGLMEMAARRSSAVALICCAASAGAAVIDVPNVFSSGGVIVAQEMNENFSTVFAESNDQDARLGSVERGVEDALADLSTVEVEVTDVTTKAAANEASISELSLRVSSLESGVEDQLVCIAVHSWPIDFGTSYPCVQHSDPLVRRDLTYDTVVGEGWTLISAGGDDNNRSIFIFSR